MIYMERVFEKTEKYILLITIFLLPFTVITISPNPYVVPKLAIAGFGIILLLILLAVRVVTIGKFTFSLSNYDFPVLLIAVTYISSTVIKTPNKMEALLLPGTTTAVVAGALLYFLVNQVKNGSKEALTKILLISGAVFSAFIILAFTGLFNSIPQLPAFMKAKTYSPEGGYLPSAIYLLALLPLGIGTILSQKDINKRAVNACLTLLISAGFLISAWHLLPSKAFYPRFPSWKVSWSVAIDSLKESPILGIGPGNYLTAFSRYRPISYNATDLWALRFATANNHLMTVFTEAGIIGLAGYIILAVAYYKNAKRDLKEKKLVNWGFAGISGLVSFLILFLTTLLFPATALLIIMFFILLALGAKTTATAINLTTAGTRDNQEKDVTSRLPAILVSLPVFALVVWGAYKGGRILLAEYYFQRSLTALANNEAKNTYDNMRRAIILNPRVDRYRASFSRVNLVLADSVAKKAITPPPPSGPEGSSSAGILSEKDQNDISQMIQVAISEAKATVALNPLRAANWEILGRTYQSIIPLAKGADVFAAQSFRQAIALDPVNPSYRIILGGLYYGAKDYETATRIYELAVATKPDLANSHFNLAYSYSQQGKTDLAIQQMTLTLSLLDPKSKDYETAKAALDTMEAKKKTATEATAGENLTPPAQPTPAIKPQVELPAGSEPPEAPITPTATPIPENSEPSPTPTVQP